MAPEKEVKSVKKDAKKKSAKKAPSEYPDIAVVRIRGVTGVNTKINDTLMMLNIHRKNYCTVVPGNPSMMGMIKKVKDFVTYGEIDEETKKLLTDKRGEKAVDGKMKPFFRLNPPKGGYERKGIKVPFSIGGVLGNRKEKINDLLKRML